MLLVFCKLISKCGARCVDVLSWTLQHSNATHFIWLNALTSISSQLNSIDLRSQHDKHFTWNFLVFNRSATGCNGAFAYRHSANRKYLIIFCDVWIYTQFDGWRDVIAMKSYRINLTATQIMRKIPHWWFCVYFGNFHRKCIPNCTWFCTCGKCTDEVGKYRKFSMWFINVRLPNRTRFKPISIQNFQIP